MAIVKEECGLSEIWRLWPQLISVLVEPEADFPVTAAQPKEALIWNPRSIEFSFMEVWTFICKLPCQTAISVILVNYFFTSCFMQVEQEGAEQR